MSDRKSGIQSLLVAGSVAAAVACSQWASMLLWMPNPKSHMVWFPGAVLLAALLIQPIRRWWLCVVATAVGEAAAFGVLGIPALTVTWAMAGSLLLTPLAAAALGCLRSRMRSPLEDFRLLTAFVLLAGLALPALSAAWIAWATRSTVLEPYLSDWPNVSLAQSLGNLMLVPVVVWGALRKRNPVPLQVTGMAYSVGAGLLVLLCLLWSAQVPMQRLQPMMMVAPVPFLIWAMVAFRAVGASLAMLAVGLLAMHFSAAGIGPFIRDDLATTTVAVQLWTASLTVALLYMSVVVEQRATRTQALQQAHEQLQAMTEQLMRAQEDERSRIARDLHDGINQSIASVAIRLSMARQQAAHGPDRELLAQLQEAVTAVSEDVRRISHELHPSLLRYTGLPAALQSLCEGHAGAAEMHMELADLPDLPLETATALYRIAQEALRNVDKHARARNVYVRLWLLDDRVSLEVRDDGIGWDQSGPGPAGGLGMLSMMERARAIGGELTIVPDRRGGICVVAQVPLRARSHFSNAEGALLQRD